MSRIRLTGIGSCFAVATVAAMVAPAYAAFFRNSAGIASPAVVVSFDEHLLADQTPMAGQYTDVGISGTTNLFFHNFPSGVHVNGNPNVVGNFVWNYAPGYVSPFSIRFTHDQTAAAFAISGEAAAAVFEALLEGVVVDSGTADIEYGITDVNDFYGFSGILFDEIRVTSSGGSFVADVDNVQLSVVPEPSTFVLALLAATGMIGAVIARIGSRRLHHPPTVGR